MEKNDWIRNLDRIEQEELAEQKRKFKEQLNSGQPVDTSDMSTVSRDNHTIINPLLKEVDQVIWNQQEKVLRSGKYPHPIHKDNHTALEWMDHQMSEFADALVYRECLKQTIDDVIYLINQAKDFNMNHNRSDRQDIVNAILGDALKRLRG
jgi:hypothetical protein